MKSYECLEKLTVNSKVMELSSILVVVAPSDRVDIDIIECIFDGIVSKVSWSCGIAPDGITPVEIAPGGIVPGGMIG